MTTFFFPLQKKTQLKLNVVCFQSEKTVQRLGKTFDNIYDSKTILFWFLLRYIQRSH